MTHLNVTRKKKMLNQDENTYLRHTASSMISLKKIDGLKKLATGGQDIKDIHVSLPSARGARKNRSLDETEDKEKSEEKQSSRTIKTKSTQCTQKWN